jgi:uncharacterized protein (DUF4415 family)
MKSTSKTDWEALKAMKNEEIDYSEIAPLSDAFFKRARVLQSKSKVTLTMQVDADIVEWFQKASDNWEAQVQAALRFYVESHRAYRIT